MYTMNRLEFKDRFIRGLLFAAHYEHGEMDNSFVYDSNHKCVAYSKTGLQAIYTVDDLWYNCLVDEKHWGYFYFEDVPTDRCSLRC